MNRYVSFGLLLAVILFVAFLFYKVMAGFILPLFLAALLVVIFRPVHVWSIAKCNNRPKLAAVITTAIIMLIVLLPFMLLTIFATAESRTLIRRLDPDTFGQKIVKIRTSLGLNLPSAEQFEDVEYKIDAIQHESNPDAMNVPGLALNLNLKFENFEQACRRLGTALSLNWNEQVPDADPEKKLGPRKQPSSDLWVQFNQQVNATRGKFLNVDWKTATEENTAVQLFLEFQQSVRDSELAFRNFKTSFLGGPTWVWMRELANPNEEDLTNYLESVFAFLRSHVFSYGSATGAFIVRAVIVIAIMIIALYFFLLDGPRMLDAVKALSPLEDAYEEELIQEFDKVSRAVVLATLLSAVVQGVLAAIGFYFVGLDSVFLLMLLTTVFALIPFVGAAAVWVPACLWLFFFDGMVIPAIALAIYGFFVISMADNVIKPLVLHGQSNLHPLWALLSVLGGVAALGPIGILVGPMVVAFLQTLLKILQKELITMAASTEEPSATSSTIKTTAESQSDSDSPTESVKSTDGDNEPPKKDAN